MKRFHVYLRSLLLFMCLWTIAVFTLTISAIAAWNDPALKFDGTMSPPAAPQLLAPADGAFNQSTDLTFVWRSSPGAQYYNLQVSTDSTFSMSSVNDTSLTDTVRTVAGLPNNITLFWRVSALNGDGNSPYSTVRSFRTVPPSVPGQVILLDPTPAAVDVSLPVTFSWESAPGAVSYQIQVSTNASFTAVNYDQSGLTLTSTTVSSLADSTLYYWRMRATGSSGTGIWSAVWSFTTVNQTPPSVSEPILYMPFDGNINDLSSARHSTWISERVDWVPDRFGREAGACGFNGYIGYVVIDDGTGALNFNVRTQSYTVSCWVKVDSLTPNRDQELVIDGFPFSYDLLYQGSTSHFVAKCWDGTHYIVVPGTTMPVAGQWYHVAMVADMKRITLYVNGTPENADSIPSAFGSTRNIGVRRAVGSYFGDHFLHGAMDDLRIHNRALSALEIDSLYQQEGPPVPPPTDNLALYMPFDGNTLDASGNGNTGTSDGGSYGPDPWGHPGSAYFFSGWNLHVNGIKVPNSPSLHPTDGLTIAFWLRLEVPQTGWKLVSKSVSDQPSDREYSFGLNVGGGIDTVGLSAATPGGGAQELTGVGAPFWEWHHFAGVIDRKDSHTMKLYLDGTLSKTVTDNAVGFVPDTGSLTIGMGQGMTTDPSAIMDDLRIYTRALSAREVNSLYRYVGKQATPILVASETHIDFGFVRLGESISHEITLTNTSLTDTMHINAIAHDNPDFSIDATAPLLIAPGGNQILHLVYAPTSVGIDSDAVVQITVSNPGIPPVWLILYGRTVPDSALIFHANSGWNIVSVPVLSADRSKSSLFPTAVSQAFAYIGEYVKADTLTTGTGYWMKFQKAEPNFVVGNQMIAETISVGEGWNLIGSISNPVPVSSITTDAEGTVTSQFFGYGEGYFTSDTIYPGQGYWVKADRNCNLILTATSANSLAKMSAARIHIVATTEMPPPAPNEKGIRPRPRPTAFVLNQNYPNPFNPSTVISYALPTASHVRLVAYNMLGQEVMVLVDQMQEAGYKSVSVNAADLSTGVYTYRLTAGTYTQVKKMLLVK
ncbi:MAG TPA: LamG-like jellyroll fold domain-containing protein [Bacteroidota bacterium]|nr:LamG-like jellyroll fold domain-containing protein [Bacteroidota bacterium]